MARRHARRSTSTALARPIVMSAPRPAPIIIRAPSTKAVKHKKHRRSGVAGAAYEERHRLGAIGGGFILGMIDKSGVVLPTLPFLGKAGTLGAAAWAFGKYGKSPWASHAATGLLAIAAYELAKQGSIDGTDGYVAGM